MKTTTLLLLTLLLIPLSAQAATKNKAPSGGPVAKLQCWTDNKGVRSCGDRVPPEYAKDEREVLNQQGIVVSTKSRQKTDAEIAEEQRKAEAASAEKKRFEEQAAYDKYMLQTFDSVTQMNAVRETRVVTLDGRLRLAEKSVGDTENSLKGLKERANTLKQAGKPVDPRLAKQIAEFETSLVDTLKSIAQLKTEREQTALKFDNDVERYKKLRAGEIQMGSAPQGTVSGP